VRVAGLIMLIAGAIVLIQAFARFVTEGHGTPAPVAPTERLVIGGLYRYVRNPMYLAVVAVITGQALALGQPVLLGYAALVWVTVASFVRWYEEPALARQFGAQYQAYRRSVPAWLPRTRPWRPGEEVPDSRTGRYRICRAGGEARSLHQLLPARPGRRSGARRRP
jgi:protein-S-isoprenylcysteine O-methyltransferase Ste14